jgi:predicted dehydrogenase
MKVGVIGYGSIGKRHIKNLISLGINNIVLFRELSKENDLGLKEVYSMNDFLTEEPDFIILSNPTSLHFQYLSILLSENISVLVEKPLVLLKEEIEKTRTLLNNYTGIGMIAYNMRFHPCTLKCLEIVQSGLLGKLYQSRFFVGQYLPDWRPEMDYRFSYSAHKSMGGGVLLDLIHEIDLAILFSGLPSQSLTSYLWSTGNLEIDTEDMADISYISQNKLLVNIHLDYLTRGIKRDFQLFGSEGWLTVNFIENSINVFCNSKGNLEFHFKEFHRNQMYMDLMIKYLEYLTDKRNPIPDLHDGIKACELALTANESNIIKS